jgi:RNA polymerase sigma factor (sigma-70 family)
MPNRVAANFTDVSAGASDWPELIERVRTGAAAAVEELYRLIESIAGRRYACRLSPGDARDRLHDVFLIVLQAIGRGSVRKPGALAPYIRTVLRYQAAASVRGAVRQRRFQGGAAEYSLLQDQRSNPEETLLQDERKNLVEKSIRALCGPDREILSRFYLHDQPREQICSEMHLSSTQFRLNKWRAKERFIRTAAKLL